MEIPLKTVVSQARQAFGKRNFTAKETVALQSYIEYYELLNGKAGRDNKLVGSSL